MVSNQYQAFHPLRQQLLRVSYLRLISLISLIDMGQKARTGGITIDTKLTKLV